MTMTAPIGTVLDARYDESGLHGPALNQAGILNLHRDRPRLRGVSVAGMHVGRIVDVVLDGDARRVAGFDVRLSEGERRFVPLVAVASLGPSGIELDSALHLIDDVRFYDRAGLTLSALLTLSAACRHTTGVAVADVIVDLGTGEVVGFELADGAIISREGVSVSGEAIRLVCDCAA
jgi:PRC-barrel domain